MAVFACKRTLRIKLALHTPLHLGLSCIGAALVLLHLRPQRSLALLIAAVLLGCLLQAALGLRARLLVFSDLPVTQHRLLEAISGQQLHCAVHPPMAMKY
jgi:hypothetical protein